MQSRANLSNLLSATIDELRDNSRAVVIFLAIVVPVSAIASGFGTPSSSLFGFDTGLFADTLTFMSGPLGAISGLAAFCIEVAATYWLYSAMVRRDTAADFGRIWPFIGIYILSMIAIGFGFLLLIVPGVILLVRWVLVLPLVVRGDVPAMDTFGESWLKTQGAGLSIFGALIILVIASWIIGSIIGVGGFAFSGFGSIGTRALGALAESVMTTVFAAFAVGAYRLLQDDTEELAQVFE